MNKTLAASFTLLAAGLLAVGCENETTTTPAGPTGTTGSARDAATPEMPAAHTGRTPTGADLPTTREAGAAMDDARTRGADALESGRAAAADAGSGVVAQAQKLYADAEAAIGKLDMNTAQKHLDQLKGLSDKLPPEWKTRVDALSQRVADLRAKAPAMPSMPSMPQ